MGITQITKKSVEWEGCDDESAACVDGGVVAVMRTILDGLERAPFLWPPHTGSWRNKGHAPCRSKESDKCVE